MEAYRKVLSRPFYRGLSQASVFGEYINVVQKPQESSLEGSSLGLFFSCDIWQNKLNPKRKKDIELCGTARDDKISVRPVKSITASERLQTQWITCTDATRFIMEKCPSECERKEPKCKGRRPVEGTFLFNCPQTLPGPSQCRGIWLSCFIRTAVERKKGRGREWRVGGGGWWGKRLDRSLHQHVCSFLLFLLCNPPTPNPPSWFVPSLRSRLM